MTESFLRRTFFIGTMICGAILGALTIHSLRDMVSARTPPLTVEAVAGKHVWQQRDCNDCHTILGIGGYYAPELTRVVDRRDDAWLRAFLRNPTAAKPGTSMPDQRLSDSDVEALIAFHHWVNGINTNSWPPAPKLVGGENGALLFDQKGCSSCHRFGGRGESAPGSDLTRFAERPDARSIAIATLEDPKAINPNTGMPRPDLTVGERAALVSYLAERR
jgi:nitric oxide reductase subunit C